jgi:diguanylate cyclase (GGDEF)-like protein/PAS domain S-box-containing protein
LHRGEKANESGFVVRYLENHSIDVENLFEALPCSAALLDAQGVIRDLNQHFADITGYLVDDLIGRDFRVIVPLQERISPFIAPSDGDGDFGFAHIVRDQELAVLCRDGHEIPADFSYSRLKINDQSWTVVEMHDKVLQNGTKNADETIDNGAIDFEASLANSEQRFRLAFEKSMAPMVFSDRDGLFLAVNSAFCEMCGRSEEELIGRDSKSFTYPEDIGISEKVNGLIKSGEIDEHRYGKRFLHKNGRIVFAEVSICCSRDAKGEALYYVSSVRDVTEERALAAQLSFQALHDPLTGLANRALFDDRLVQARSRTIREVKLGAVLLLDLDDFKGVNDSYGHLVGDQLLIEIASRFKQVTRTSDMLCRFGGDEFLYLAEGLTSPDEGELIARRLLDTLSEPFIYGDIRLKQHASVGVAVWDGEIPDNVQLVQDADAAMYEAKRRGHGCIEIFTPKIGHEAFSRFALVQELREALTNGDVAMHYQPIIDLASGTIVGFEALMRWQHPERGWIPPDVFIPLAEQSDLIFELGSFALRTAMAAASTWKATNPNVGLPYVTVNLSAHQFHDPGLISLIRQELESSAISPERLILEVTESVALADIAETLNIMDELNRLKIGIALDDFGTGYSSLSYLAALNPKIIKIDQSFVRPKHDKKRSDTLLEAIVSLGNKLNMTVLAEGIETPAQLDRLHNLDCDLGQGFLWSPAVPVQEAIDMLAQSPEG